MQQAKIAGKYSSYRNHLTVSEKDLETFCFVLFLFLFFIIIYSLLQAGNILMNRSTFCYLSPLTEYKIWMFFALLNAV